MKARSLGRIIFAISTCLLVGYLAKIFFHHVEPVNYAQGLESLKDRGAPDFRLPLVTLRPPVHITDDSVGRPELHADITIINFWASWCAPCTREMPSLAQLAKKYAGDSRLEVIGVSEDKNPHQMIHFLEKSQDFLGTADSNFKFLWDGNFDVANRFGTQKIPETYILDKNHKLIRKSIDEQNWMSKDFIRWLDSILAGAS